MARLALLLLVLISVNLVGCATQETKEGAAGRSEGEFFRRMDESLSRRIYGPQETRKKYNYQRSQGLVIRLLDKTIKPRGVKRGNQVVLTLKYAVMGSSGSGAALHLKKSLWYQKQKMTTILEADFTRSDGTWEDNFLIDVPPAAEPGVYVIGLILSSAGKEEKDFESFTVKP